MVKEYPKMNQFIICGASRAGKSNLAKRIQEEFNVSWIVGDSFTCAMEDAFPQAELRQTDHDPSMGDKLENFVSYLLWNYAYEGCGYVLDSVHLWPQNITAIRKKIGNVPAVYLGHVSIDPQDKLQAIRRHDPPDNWWTAEMSDRKLIETIKTEISRSEQLKEACKRENISFFDTGAEL
jgi:hypothetical protein